MSPRPPFVPAAVVFDLDGLLVDSEGLWEQAEQRVVTELGYTWDPAYQQAMLGRGAAEAAAVLASLIGEDAQMLDERLRAASEEQFRHGIPLRPGAGQLVRRLTGRVPLAVATNSRRVLADLALESAGIADHLDIVVTHDDVERAKPAPDPYVTACRKLGADPTCSVALEDSPVGVASAVAAGLWVVGCPSQPGEQLPQAHTVVCSLDEVDPVALLGS